jgi:succinate dehydrogenase hydrophobic anchor subunit
MGFLIAYVLGILTASKAKNQPTSHIDYTANPPYTQPPPDRPISVVCIPPTESDQEKAKKKQKERRKTVKFWAEIISAFVLFGYFTVTILIWCANKKSAETATKELELSQRPWVSMEHITVISPLVFDSNGATTTISYDFTNTGHSPAIDGEDLFDFMVPFAATPSPVAKRDDLCKGAGDISGRIHARGIGQFSKTFFPGQPQPMTFKISWNINDIKKAMVDIPKKIFPESTNPLPTNFMPTMIVCIAYRSSFTKTQYHTGYIVELVHKKTFAGPPFMERGEIPAKELQFVYDPSWAVYAD